MSIGYRRWNNVPGSLKWGNPSGSLDSELQAHSTSLSLRRRGPAKSQLHSSKKVPLNYYDNAGEVSTDGDEIDILAWVSEEEDRGVLRVYQPGSTFSELVKCTLKTDTELIVSVCIAEELRVHYGNNSSQILDFDASPLEEQNRFLRAIGHRDPARIQWEGIQRDLGYMFKFVAGEKKKIYI